MITLLYVGSSLIVLGFTFMVIKASSKITRLKGKAALDKLERIGLIPIFAGVFLTVMSFVFFDENIRKAMLTSSFNLVGLGVTTLIQRFITPKNEKCIVWAANGAVIVGFLLWIVYSILIYFFPS
jgi:hypothetical protein